MDDATPDRRRGNRLRSLLGARIRTALHLSETDCVVRDLGPDGLRIAVSDTVPLPDLFDFHISKTRQTRQVRLVWRGDDFVGVNFVAPPPPATSIPFGLMRDLRAARQEIVSLRLQLSQAERQV